MLMREFTKKEKLYLSHVRITQLWTKEVSDEELLTGNTCQDIRLSYYSAFEDCQEETIKVLVKTTVEKNAVHEILNLG